MDWESVKHQVPDTLKFRKLQRRLGVSRVVTAGTLELLWIAVQKNAPRGDIGRFDNESIAIECDWEGNPDELVNALVETGWLELSDEHRLIVHDWHEHAPYWVKGVAERTGGFVTIVRDYSTELKSGTIVPPASEQRPNVTQRNVTQRERGEQAPPRARPTLDEVSEYRKGRKSAVDAEKFFDHYEANGWVQANGNPINDWKAAFRTWEKREGDFGSRSPPYKPPAERKKDPKLEFELRRSALVKKARDEEWSDDRLREAIDKIRTTVMKEPTNV